MKLITRKKGQLKGEYIVYDSIEEATQNVENLILNLHKWNDYKVKAGDWVVYPDGVVAQVLRVNPSSNPEKRGVFTFTALNLYKSCWKTTESNFRDYRLGSHDPKLDIVDDAKLKFVEEWLLNGTKIETAVRMWCWKFNRNQKVGDFAARRYAYLLLSGSWFDQVLKDNRLIRDRYMSLIGALNSEGVTEVYVAKKIKDHLESGEAKLMINALNQAIELHEAEAQRKKRPINAPWQVEAPKDASLVPPKEIPEHLTQPNLLDTIAGDLKREKERSNGGSSKAEGNSPVSTEPSNVRAEASDREHQPVESVAERS
jgi:hypothetical protein